MAPPFEIRVLGDFSVRRGGAPIVLPQSRKTRALLAFLSVVGKPQRRERLCELFWDVPDDPRGALRWSLSKLRQIFNADGVERLAADRNSVELKPGSFTLDHDAIRGLSPDAVSAQSTERLEAIVSAFTGPFLSDLQLSRCQVFEAWRVSLANETELVRLKALRALVDRYAGEPDRALPHLHLLQSLLPEDDLAEEINRMKGKARVTVAARQPAVVSGGATGSSTKPEVPASGEAATGRAPPIWQSPSSARQNIRYTNSRDGTRIAYATSGSGPVIVRASHWMSHLEFDWESPVWGHWIDALSTGFTFVRYDGRLNGLSDTNCDDVSLDAFVADLECVVEAAGLDRFVLLGISQGCPLAVEYALRHPEKIAGLVICGGFARGWRVRGNHAEVARREAIQELMRQGWGQDDPLFRQMFTNLFIPGANRLQMDWFNDLQRQTLTPENAIRLSAASSAIDMTRALPRLSVPTLVLHAKADRVVPFSEGVEVAAGIKNARFVELDSANHILLGDERAFRNFVVETTAFAREALKVPAAVPIDPRTRRQATILSAGFAYAQEVFASLAPEVALAKIDPVLADAAKLIDENGGAVLSRSENELIASFGAPQPMEEHAALACRAALALRDLALPDEKWMAGLRVVLDTGIVIVGPGNDSAMEVRGGPVSVARALSHTQPPNMVVATARTRASAGGSVRMQPLPTASSPESATELFEVTEIRRGRSRWQLRAETQLSPFIGREMHLQMLNKAWRDASVGEGQTMVVVGEPGVGKSRVTHEFVGAIPQDEAENLEVGALETDLRSGFVVIRKVLQALFGIGDTESPSAAAEKIIAARKVMGFDARILDPITAILELPGQQADWTVVSGLERSRRMQEAAVALLLYLGHTKPVVLLVEDLQWIDAESEAVLLRLAQAVPAVAFLLILTCRPEYDRSAFAAAGAAEIRLPRLNAVEMAALLDHLVGIDPTLEGLRADVSAACKGNALFMEETIRALAETGKLDGKPGRYRPTGEVGPIVVSANIQTIVDSRFERLEGDAKRLAEVASIFDGEIPVILLRKMSALSPPRFDGALQSLRNADLLIETQVFPEASVCFKHALIRAAVSQRILSSTLIELNKAALANLTAYYADRLEEHSERLAAHAQQAQQWTEAVGYLLTSARKAIRRSAHATALDQLDLGIWLLRSNEVADADDREIEFQLARGVALMAARGWGSTEVLAAFERAEKLCAETGDQARLFTALRGRAQYYMLSGKPAAAQALADRWVGMVRDHNDPGLAIETEHMLWTNNFFLGETREADQHAERAVLLYEPERDHQLTYKYSGHDPGVCCRCFAGLSAWLAGEPERARLRCDDALELATRLQHPLSLALAYWGRSYLHILRDEPEAALLVAESELAIAERFHLPLLIGQAHFQIGWGRYWLGERGVGLSSMEESISAIRYTGAEMGLPYLIALYAAALSDSGKQDEARKTIEAALELGRLNGTYFQLAELLRIEASIRALSGGGAIEIERMLGKAAEIAALQHSAIGQLRVALALSEHLRNQGEIQRACDVLAGYADLTKKLDDSRHIAAAVGNVHAIRDHP